MNSGIVHASASAPLAAASPCAMIHGHVGQQQQLQQNHRQYPQPIDRLCEGVHVARQPPQQSSQPVDRLRETMDRLQQSAKTMMQLVSPQPGSPQLPAREAMERLQLSRRSTMQPVLPKPGSPQLPAREAMDRLQLSRRSTMQPVLPKPGSLSPQVPAVQLPARETMDRLQLSQKSTMQPVLPQPGQLSPQFSPRETMDHLQLSQKPTMQPVLPKPGSLSPQLPARETMDRLQLLQKSTTQPVLPRQGVSAQLPAPAIDGEVLAANTTPGYAILTKSIISSQDATTQESDYAGSDMNTSVGGTSPANAFGSPHSSFEKRLTWLEEDVAVLRQRVKEQFGDDDADRAAADPGLRSLVTRLEGELAEQRRLRGQLEAGMKSLEATMHREQKEHEAQLRGFSSELESKIRPLISGIDNGLLSGATFTRERTDNAEERLRSLMTRMEQSLMASAAPPQGPVSLVAQHAFEDSMGAVKGIKGKIKEMSVQSAVASTWRRSPVGSQVPSCQTSQAGTPMRAAPSTMQVPGFACAPIG